MDSRAIASAAERSEAAIAAGSGDAYDLAILGLARTLAGDRDGGSQFFAAALQAGRDDPAVLVLAAMGHHHEGRLRDAVLACDRATAIAPYYAEAWLQRGTILAAGGSAMLAEESFARANSLDPSSVPAIAALGAMALRRGALDLAAERAAAALRLDPTNAEATRTAAAVALERGDPSATVALLKPHVRSLEAGTERSQVHTLLGNAASQLGQTDTAYDWYVRAKADFAIASATAPPPILGHREFVTAIDRALEQAMPTWGAPLAGPASVAAAKAHLFLIGYPRSGTTLLENVLASLGGVYAVEERPTFGLLDKALLSGDAEAIAAGMASFARWDDDHLEETAQAYWEVARAAGVPAGARALVDMDPLKATRLPFIARMFPAAKVIVMRRDPRDVVWSCFKTNFALTSNTLEFTSLERAARHYDAMMRLTDRALSCLPLTVLEVDYQRLVGEFDTVTREICDFAGLEWDVSLRQFDRTAQARGVGTASATQVRRGLYDGSGQWRPFAKYFEPIRPILAPWIERFGAKR